MMEFENVATGFYYDEKRLKWAIWLAFNYNQETHCHMCNKRFNIDHTDEIRDHDNVTGNYRGAALKWWNMRLRRTCNIPSFFQNFRGYDSHFISMAMKDFRAVDILVIGQGMEKYLTVSHVKYRICTDSLMFLGASLATLAKNLQKTGLESFIRLPKKFHGFEAEDMRLLVRKGVYPYEYMDSCEKMEERQISPKEAFYSKLADNDISDDDYLHAFKV